MTSKTSKHTCPVLQHFTGSWISQVPGEPQLPGVQYGEKGDRRTHVYYLRGSATYMDPPVVSHDSNVILSSIKVDNEDVNGEVNGEVNGQVDVDYASLVASLTKIILGARETPTLVYVSTLANKFEYDKTKQHANETTAFCAVTTALQRALESEPDARFANLVILHASSLGHLILRDRRVHRIVNFLEEAPRDVDGFGDVGDGDGYGEDVPDDEFLRGPSSSSFSYKISMPSGSIGSAGTYIKSGIFMNTLYTQDVRTQDGDALTCPDSPSSLSYDFVWSYDPFRPVFTIEANAGIELEGTWWFQFYKKFSAAASTSGSASASASGSSRPGCDVFDGETTKTEASTVCEQAARDGNSTATRVFHLLRPGKDTKLVATGAGSDRHRVTYQAICIDTMSPEKTVDILVDILRTCTQQPCDNEASVRTVIYASSFLTNLASLSPKKFHVSEDALVSKIIMNAMHAFFEVTPSSRLDTVRIVHLTNHTGFLVPKDNRIRKVVNIFPASGQVAYTTEDFLLSVMPLEGSNAPPVWKDRTYEYEIQEATPVSIVYHGCYNCTYRTPSPVQGFSYMDDLSKHETLKVDPCSLFYTDKVAFAFRYASTEQDGSAKSLADAWWFKWQTAVPLCASKRLIQTTGTCWFNTAVNMLLLTPAIYEMLKASWHTLGASADANQKKLHELSKKFNIGMCLVKSQANLELLFWALVYNLVVKDSVAEMSDGNFMGRLAAYVKATHKKGLSSLTMPAETLTPQQVYDRNASFGDGYAPCAALPILLKQGLPDADYVIVNWDLKYAPGTPMQNRSLMNEQLKQFISGSFASANKPRASVIVLTASQYYGFGVPDSHLLTADIPRQSAKFQYPMGNIPILRGNYNDYAPRQPSQLPDVIEVGDRRFLLQSIALIIDLVYLNGKLGAHAVCGATCNGARYIFDSNDVLVPCDWRVDTQPYRDEVVNRQEFGPSVLYAAMLGIDSAIYVEDDVLIPRYQAGQQTKPRK
jgi:hypothetical protein